MSKVRRKRASVGDLYKSCQLGGDCLPDVKNKVEGTTLADRLLQIFGSFLYFGGLGIGTGKGSGGVTTIRPIAPSRIPVPETVRPNVIIDPLGGTEVIPLDVLDSSAPAIVPLTDAGVPETSIISSGANPAIIDTNVEILTTEDTTITNVPRGDHPAVINITDEGTTVLDVQRGPPPPKRLQLDTAVATNTIELTTTPFNYKDFNVNIFVDPQFTGEFVGTEEIPLQEINLRQEFEIEEPVIKSSTPKEKAADFITGAKQLYNRYVSQIPTTSLDIVVKPSRQVTFDFENPAFDDDVSLEFAKDVEEVTAAPNPDFRDIQKLSRPQLSATHSGAVRYSRLGQRASMKTRSGLVVGEQVHFYYDISRISEPEVIELPTIGQTSGESIIYNGQAESSFIHAQNINSLQFSEDDLLDADTENFNNAHLIIQYTNEEGESTDIISLTPDYFIKPYTPVIESTFVNSTVVDTALIPVVFPIKPLTPSISTSTYFGEDYVIEPDLLRRRKRRYIY